MRAAWLACCAIGFSPIAHAQELSFADALARAAEGPSVEAGRASARAAELAVGPAGQLPDPELVLGVENVPVSGIDRYRLDRDEMTMQRIGIMQEMPNGLGARRAMAEAQAERASVDLDLARLEAQLGAAQAWIALHYAQRRTATLAQLLNEAQASAAAARARLSSGAGSVDDAIAAEIEAARLEDRVATLHADAARARAELRRWIGDAADGDLSASAPTFEIDPEHMRQHLRRHPELAAFNADEDAAEAELALARAERRPDWSWELSYGRRDPSFGDMASVEVRVGLPLFQPWRQGPLVAARRADLVRVGAERSAVEREHASMLEGWLAEHAATSSNLARARDIRLPLARRRAASAMGAFGAGTTSTSDVIEARRGLLEAELELFDLEERRALIGATLTLQYAVQTP